MALKKASKFSQASCESDAKKIIQDWFFDKNRIVPDESIRIIWFALLHNGYRCMVNSSMYDNLFFELVRNTVSGEYTIHCFERFEYVAHPSNEEPIIMTNRKPTFVRTDSSTSSSQS